MSRSAFEDVVRSFKGGRFHPKCACCRRILPGIEGVRIDYESETFVHVKQCEPATDESAPTKRRVLISQFA